MIHAANVEQKMTTKVIRAIRLHCHNDESKKLLAHDIYVSKKKTKLAPRYPYSQISVRTQSKRIRTQIDLTGFSLSFFIIDSKCAMRIEDSEKIVEQKN